MPYPLLTISNKLRLCAHRCLGAFGFDIVRTCSACPNEPIMGSFPPHREYLVVGRAENYFIHAGYRHRTEAIYYDDTENRDQWQNEVYKFAREVFDQKNLKAVCDVGCGSGYKLVKYFKDCNIIGLDAAKTCAWLRREYPHLTWMELGLKSPPSLQADLIIASDVIEHLLDPDDLLSYLAALNPRFIVLSTPDRNLLRAGTHNGPPRNPAHVREWSFVEFEAYIASRFEVWEHFISNSGQATQCLLCAPRCTE
jgi:SAM-dependent methyltransferase